MSSRLSLALACLAGVLLAPAVARAQEAGSGTEDITSPVANPERFLTINGVRTDVTSTPRPQNLNPEGVNFTDCEQNLEMDFSLIISGFQAGDGASIQIWAGVVDCTQDQNRDPTGVTGSISSCWKVGNNTGTEYAVSALSLTTNIFARDVLHFENAAQTAAFSDYDPSYHSTAASESACHVQTSDAAVGITVYFIPVNSSNEAIGTAYSYALSTDLVAPPPPEPVSVQGGDTLALVNWTVPGNDPDIAGFSVYSDPPPGGSTTGGCSCGQVAGNGANSYIGGDAEVVEEAAVYYPCAPPPSDASEENDGNGLEGAADAVSEGASAPTEAAASDGAASDATASDATASDAETDAAADAAKSDAGDGGLMVCNPINIGGSGEAGACADFNLSANTFIVGGGTTTTETTADGAVITVTTDAASSTIATTTTADGSVVASTDGGVSLSGGGISQINPKYKGGELDSNSATSLTLTGLTNYLYYKVGVSTIDGSGNVGPISQLQCVSPAPVNDYWKTYKQDGGGTNGCTFEGSGANAQAPVFAFGLLGAVVAFFRRRRR